MNLGILVPETDRELKMVARILRAHNVMPERVDGYYHLEYSDESFSALVSSYKTQYREDPYMAYFIDEMERQGYGILYGIKVTRVEETL